ncbi:MAG: zinc ribbon domain-containing protein [Kiritimatiellae bacterium]|nr:zinc ribbon domain-containing protein [Kiritimatiellia bacterium]
MPIYEFYCSKCHMIFNFLSKSINITRTPVCPRCKKRNLKRQISSFAVTSGGNAPDGPDDMPFDEQKMERAITELAGDAENINENDPKAAAQLMRKFSKMTGMELGEGMEQAIDRMEAGEDPEQIEADMGSLMEDEEPFILSGKKGRGSHAMPPPGRDQTLYEL